jgi:hypothetical protein
MGRNPDGLPFPFLNLGQPCPVNDCRRRIATLGSLNVQMRSLIQRTEELTTNIRPRESDRVWPESDRVWPESDRVWPMSNDNDPEATRRAMARGLRRTRDGFVTEHGVLVDYGNSTSGEVPESQYRARGYQPPFEQLPWQAEDEGDNA